jgi:hypothetical protein
LTAEINAASGLPSAGSKIFEQIIASVLRDPSALAGMMENEMEAFPFGCLE